MAFDDQFLIDVITLSSKYILTFNLDINLIWTRRLSGELNIIAFNSDNEFIFFSRF